ncbi:protein phosphatase 2C domain-containing protein [Sorangium sp. So ce185]|uniref:protein phosphatase 2C domain-containing protein n=1 Tax=Sorangium sp. So ce185 TaxID=3133287 RepID=UPI003F5E204C
MTCEAAFPADLGGGSRFEVAGGTVTGTDHLAVGRPNQDAYAFRAEGGCLAAVVCDGCGSGARSEVGAALGARLVTEQVLGALRRGGDIESPETWEEVRRGALAPLRAMAAGMGGSLAEVVSTYFLFTVVGLAVSGDRACAFSLGDGLIALGDELLRLGPFPRNEPPYLAYGLLERPPGGEAPRFTVHRAFPSSALQTALLGTDGAIDLLESSCRQIPGGGGAVGPLSRFWEDDRMFANPDAVRRRLALINRAVTRPVWKEERMEREGGLLRDDTTLVVVRRAQSARD